MLPILGKIRKGGPKEIRNGKEVYGKDLDHFRFTSDDPVMTRRFAEIYGEKPERICVGLPFPTTDQNFSAWKEKWKGGGLEHRCDGVTTHLWLQPNGNYSDEERPCPGGCKEVGRLNVFIRELGRVALVTVLTSSKHDIISMFQTLKAMENARGDLTGIPFELTRKLVKVSSNENGQRKRRDKWLIHIEPEPIWAERLLAAQAAAALPEVPQLQLGPAPDDDEDDSADESLLDLAMPNDEFGHTDEDEEFVDCSTYDAIRKLWPQYGLKKDGKLFNIDAVAKKRYGKPLDELAQPEAEMMLEWLQTRANAIAEESAKEAA